MERVMSIKSEVYTNLQSKPDDASALIQIDIFRRCEKFFQGEFNKDNVKGIFDCMNELKTWGYTEQEFYDSIFMEELRFSNPERHMSSALTSCEYFHK